MREFLASLCIAASLLPASAQTPAEFYKGKTIYFIVGSDVGGGNDAYNKLVTRHIGRYIPGNPSVVAQNMPGASGLTVMNHVANVAAKDGTVVGATQQATPLEPLLGGKESRGKFDALKLHWIGSPNRFTAIAFSWHTSPVKTAADLLTHELLVGATGASPTGSGISDAYLAANLLGFKYRVVRGYPSATAVDLAIERGELQGRTVAGWQGLNTRGNSWLAEKRINMLYQLGLEAHATIPASVPLLQTFAKNADDRAIIDLKYAPYSLGYPNFMPEAAPADRVQAIRTAFAAVLRDAQLVQDAEKTGIELDPVSSDEMTAIIRKAYGSTPAMLDRLATLTRPPEDAK